MRDPLPCLEVYPPFALDVLPVRCKLPHGHRSDEHWHPPLWPGTPAVVWFAEPVAEAMIA